MKRDLRRTTLLLATCALAGCGAATPTPHDSPTVLDVPTVPSSRPAAPVAPATAATTASTPTLAAEAAPRETVDDLLRSLPAALGRPPANLATEPALDELARRAARIGDLTVGTHDADELPLTLASPLDAKRFVELVGLRGELFAVSGDVHQRSWRLVVKTQDVADPHGKRIATERPRLGGFVLDVALEARPEGPLPDLSAGASPAYAIGRHPMKVKRLTLERIKKP